MCVCSFRPFDNWRTERWLFVEWMNRFLPFLSLFFVISLLKHFISCLLLFLNTFLCLPQVVLSIKPIVFICVHCFSCLVFLSSCEWFSRGLFDLNHERLILTLFISLDVFVAIEWRIETHLRWDWRCVSFCCYCVLILKNNHYFKNHHSEKCFYYYNLADSVLTALILFITKDKGEWEHSCAVLFSTKNHFMLFSFSVFLLVNVGIIHSPRGYFPFSEKANDLRS